MSHVLCMHIYIGQKNKINEYNILQVRDKIMGVGLYPRKNKIIM